MKENDIKNHKISISPLEIVLAMATRLYTEHSEICSPAKNPFEVEQALQEVAKLIHTSHEINKLINILEDNK